MRFPRRPLPIPLPIGSLLPPTPDEVAPPEPFPSSLALLGPLPPTSPFHLALNYLYLSDLPDFDTSHPTRSGFENQGNGKENEKGKEREIEKEREKGNGKEKERVLIVTGPEEGFVSAIEEDDEDYIRDRGGDYTILDRVKRVDIRYCPTVQHAILLLSLLSTGKGKGKEDGSQSIQSRPGLIILRNLGSMMMDTEEYDENAPEGVSVPITGPDRKFNKEIIISDYLGLISAAKATVDHFSSLDPTSPRTQLAVLESEFSPDCTLPIFPPESSDDTITVPKSSREKRIPIRVGLERLLGPDCFGSVVPAHVDEYGAAVYTLSLAKYPDTSFSMRRRRCPRADWASAVRTEVDLDGLPLVEGDQGGWRWEWT